MRMIIPKVLKNGLQLQVINNFPQHPHLISHKQHNKQHTNKEKSSRTYTTRCVVSTEQVVVQATGSFDRNTK